MEILEWPSVIRDNEWDENGFAKIKEGDLLVPAYVASQLGFSKSGRDILNVFYTRLRHEADVLALCPFKACGEHLDFSKLENAKTIEELKSFWGDFNKIVGKINYERLMPRSKLMIALLDGGHAIDDGVSGDVGFYAAKYRGDKPIIGVRSDFRLAENLEAPINPAIRYFLDYGPYNNFFFNGQDAEDKAIECIARIAKEMKNNSFMDEI